jgi:glycosyltransferase domain-containing protein
VPVATAVILSYNRQDVLRRQLLYFANKPVHLIFADGSNADWGIGDSGSLGKMTWEYFRVTGFGSYLTRLRIAVRRVETEFMFFIDDEECILWTGVEKAVEFLKRNPDHSCAGGRADIMEITKRMIAVRPWGHWAEPFALLQLSGLDRLEVVCSQIRTANIYYQVLRTSDVQCYVEVVDQNLSIENRYSGFLEIALSGYLTLVGKWQMGTYPYWIRYRGLVKHSWDSSPDCLSTADAKDLASIFLRSSELRAKRCKKMVPEIDQDELVKVIERLFGQQILKRSFPSKHLKFKPHWHKGVRKRILKRLIKISKVLFTFAPSVYEFLYPRGLKRMSSFAKTYSKADPKVLKDMETVEELWTRFPHGLSNSQYQQELARM